RNCRSRARLGRARRRLPPGPEPANSAASKSPMRSRPDCGARNPARALPVVVLPDPDSPTLPGVGPRAMVKLTSSTPMTWFSVRSKTCVSAATGLRREEPVESSARRGLARPRFGDEAGGGAAAAGEADVLDADDLVLGAVEDLRE